MARWCGWDSFGNEEAPRHAEDGSIRLTEEERLRFWATVGRNHSAIHEN